jgi:hypothetical protein
VGLHPSEAFDALQDKRVTSYLSLHNRDGPAWKTQLVKLADNLFQGFSQRTKALPLLSAATPPATLGQEVNDAAGLSTRAHVEHSLTYEGWRCGYGLVSMQELVTGIYCFATEMCIFPGHAKGLR